MERPHANFARGLTDAVSLVTIGVANDMRKLTLYFLAMFSLTALAQEKVIRLYPGPAPGWEGLEAGGEGEPEPTNGRRGWSITWPSQP